MSAGAPPAASVVVGTRGSPLALVQADILVALLGEAWPSVQATVRIVETSGDRSQAAGAPLPEIGGKGLFTAELERELAGAKIDCAVHSLKDLPTAETPGIALGAVCFREDVRDCLVSRGGEPLSDLPEGASVGTSSLRRAAQLRALRPDLDVRPIRGNVGTRIRKVRDGEVDAVVVAAAGINRLRLESEVAEWLSADAFLPAPGQAALGIQCRADDEAALTLLAAIEDPGARAETTAERAFLAALGAGCSAPVGACARMQAPNDVSLAGLVASVDGKDVVRVDGNGSDPVELGERLAAHARSAGAAEILARIGG